MDPKKLLKSLPKRVRVGPHWWAIETPENIESEKGEHVFGQTNSRSLIIQLNKTLPSSEIVVGTFLHELYHAGLFSFGCTAPRKEEAQALFQETMWVSIYHDNPWLLDWIKKGLK